MKTTIKCSECEAGVLRGKVVGHDVGALLGMDEVRVTNLPALVCSHCGAVSVEGGLLDQLALGLAALILARPALDSIETKYLRKLMGDTQAELAEKLGVDRATVNRWENSSELLSGIQAYALRSHAFFRLRGRSSQVRVMGESFITRPPERKKKTYELDGASLQLVG